MDKKILASIILSLVILFVILGPINPSTLILIGAELLLSIVFALVLFRKDFKKAVSSFSVAFLSALTVQTCLFFVVTVLPLSLFDSLAVRMGLILLISFLIFFSILFFPIYFLERNELKLSLKKLVASYVVFVLVIFLSGKLFGVV